MNEEKPDPSPEDWRLNIRAPLPVEIPGPAWSEAIRLLSLIHSRACWIEDRPARLSGCTKRAKEIQALVNEIHELLYPTAEEDKHS